MNYYGFSPFDGPDFTNEDANYWANVDSVVSQASSLGLTVFLNPFFPGNGSEPGYLTSVTGSSDAVMSAYGTWIGNRYKGYNNIVWLLGGDSIPSTAGLYQKLNDVGAAIAAADPNHLVTLEACQRCVTNGYNSVQAFQAVPMTVPSWLSVNWAYPYYTGGTIITTVQQAYNQAPLLPPLCGEDDYEGEAGLSEPSVRFMQYAEILSGCYVGRIFGNGAIWNFNSPNGGFGPNPNLAERTFFTWIGVAAIPGAPVQQPRTLAARAGHQPRGGHRWLRIRAHGDDGRSHQRWTNDHRLHPERQCDHHYRGHESDHQLHKHSSGLVVQSDDGSHNQHGDIPEQRNTKFHAARFQRLGVSPR